MRTKTGHRDSDPDDAGHIRALGLSTGWAVFSYLIAGMLAYGAIGWLISRATHLAILFPAGMLLGLGISLAFVIYRYGRAEARASQSAQSARSTQSARSARSAQSKHNDLRKGI